MTCRTLIFVAAYLCCGCSNDSDPVIGAGLDQSAVRPSVDASVPVSDQFVATDAGDGTLLGPKIAYITIGHRMSAEIGVPGQGLSMFSLSESGQLSEERVQWDATHPVTALDYMGTTGTFLVASEDGAYSRYDVRQEPPQRLFTGQIDAAGVVTVSGGEGESVAIVSRDSSESGGIYWFDSEAGLDVAQFVGMPLAYTTAQCPSTRRWVVVGGQTTFEPVYSDDVHVVDRETGASVVSTSGDVTNEIFDLRSVAVTADCGYALFGNRSLFSETFGRLFLVDLRSGTPSLLDTVDTDEDITQVTYVASLNLFVVTSFESEQISTYVIENDRLVRRSVSERQGLISGVAILPESDGAHVVIASIHAAQGSRIGTTYLNANGAITPVTWRSLGEGGENIPSMMSHSGWLSLTDGESVNGP